MSEQSGNAMHAHIMRLVYMYVRVTTRHRTSCLLTRALSLKRRREEGDDGDEADNIGFASRPSRPSCRRPPSMIVIDDSD
eukprot:1844283-Pyramimonas_sp.AAC.1